MMIHEFQAKELLSAYGVINPGGKVAITGAEAEAIARELGTESIVVKAQVHAGGRAQADGVAMTNSPTAARSAAEAMLGKRLVTDQTGPQGRITKRVYVERGIQVAREFLIAIFIDIATSELTLIGSPDGGGDIEERARRGALDMRTLPLRPDGVPGEDALNAFVESLGVEGLAQRAFCALLKNLHRAFVELDASLIELNPLVLDKAGTLQALDVKMSFDNNAVFRHPDLAAFWDEDDLDHAELQSQRHQINYVRLDGNIGVVANGAGLGLATLDLISDAGGRAANFMDIRTTATSLDIAFGIGMLLNDPAVKVLFINVHGGGMQPCDTIAEGIGIATRRTGRSLPVVTRLAGNNASYTRSRFSNFGCPIVDCPDMWVAAGKAVSIARGV